MSFLMRADFKHSRLYGVNGGTAAGREDGRRL